MNKDRCGVNDVRFHAGGLDDEGIEQIEANGWGNEQHHG